MVFFKFVKKEILHLLNEHETFTMMILFPFLLTWVLGTALSGAFGSTFKMPEIKIPIVAQEGIMQDIYIKEGANAGIEFEKISKEDLHEKLGKGEIKKYVALNNNKITLYSDSYADLDSLAARTYSDSFVMQYNLIQEAFKSGQYSKALSSPKLNSYVDIKNIDGSKKPGSMGYYGITMLTMIMLYGAVQMMEMMGIEKYENTYLRLKSSPYSMNGVFFAKLFTAVLVLIMQAAILIVLNKYVYSVNYGSTLITLVSLMPFAVFCCGLGLLVYEMCRENVQAAGGALNVLVVLISLFGGGYVPADLMGEFIKNASVYTPAGLMNKGLFKLIYSQDSSLIIKAGIASLIAGIVFVLASFLIYTKRGGKK